MTEKFSRVLIDEIPDFYENQARTPEGLTD